MMKVTDCICRCFGGPMSDQPSGSQSGKEGGDDSQHGATACLQQKVSVSAFEAMKAMQEQGHTEMFAISPLRWCPHLETVKPIPDDGIDTGLPCETCGDASENWICLVCYKVYCSRFVQEHMLMHGLETQHLMCLSFSDLSVWCYGCDHYIDNEVLFPAKNRAHEHKFGSSLPSPFGWMSMT